MPVEESLLQEGGKVLLDDLKDRSTKVDVLSTEFQSLGAALGNETLLQVYKLVCVLVEHDAGRPPRHVEEHPTHAAVLDELSGVLDDVELLVTKATAPVAPALSDVLEVQGIKQELDGILGRLREFSSRDSADRLRHAVNDLSEPAHDALSQHLVQLVAVEDLDAATEAPLEAVDPWVRMEVGDLDTSLSWWVKGRQRWRLRMPKHLRSEVFQHLDDLVPELAALMEHTPAIGIVGIEGIGKTAIAKAVMVMVRHNFDKVVFVAVGQQLDPQQVVASMWEQLFDEPPRPMPLQALFELLVRKLKGMRVLLVLRDVWTAEALSQLNFVARLHGADSRIIVTSTVGSIFVPDEWHIVKPRVLWPQHARELLCWHAFQSRRPPQEYEEVVRGVVNECGGLPLILELTGASLRGADVAGWAARLQQLQAAESVDDDIHEQLRQRIRKSTDALPPLTHRCFVLLSMWPKDALLYRQELATLFQWVYPLRARPANEWAQEQVNILQDRCLITDKSSDGSSYTMHHIVRDVAVRESERHHSYLLDASTPEASDHVYTTAWVLRLLLQKARKLSLEAPSARWLQLEAPSCATLAGALACKHLRLLQLRRCPVCELHNVGVRMLLLRVLEVLHCTELQKLPDAIGSMVHLERITLDGCASLRALPASITCLSNLCVLEVLYCGELQCLPSAIGSMVHLERITLDGCASLNALPESIVYLRDLQHLSLRGCKALTAMPDAVGGLQQLKALLLAQCYSLVELPDSVATLPKLRELDLYACQSLRRLPPGLHRLTKLKMGKLNVGFCATPVVVQAQWEMPSLGPFKTIQDLLKWYPSNLARKRKLYFETEVFVRVLVRLQTKPAARMIVHGSRGEGKSELCDHVYDYFDQVHMPFCVPAFPDGILLLRLQPATGMTAANTKTLWPWLYEKLCVIRNGIFTRINRCSHGLLWCNIARRRDIESYKQNSKVRDAVEAVKRCIRTMLAGRRLLLLIDDAGPLHDHLFGLNGAIPPSFPGACLVTVPTRVLPKRAPSDLEVVQMRTERNVCEDIFLHINAAWREKSKEVGAKAIPELAQNPQAVTLLGRLLHDRAGARRLLEWEEAVQALDAARGGRAIEPVLVAHAAAISALELRHRRPCGHFLSALRHFQAGTVVPAAAVAAVCKACTDSVVLEALPSFLKDLRFLLPGGSLERQHDKVLLPEGCLLIGQPLLDALAVGPTAGGLRKRPERKNVKVGHASSPSDTLVMACVVDLLANCSQEQATDVSLGTVPPEEGQWLLNWRTTFGELGIHPAWLVQQLGLDAMHQTARQLLFSAAAGRVWPQLVAEATQLLSSSVSAALGVLPLLLSRNAAGQVLWEAEHADAVLVAIRAPSSKSQKDIVIKLCSALAAREVSAPDAVRMIKEYKHVQHAREALRDDFNDVADCQLLCQLRSGQFAQVLLEELRSTEGPIMAHTMGVAALGLHRHDAAVPHLQSAYDTFQRMYGPHHAGTIESGAALAYAQLGVGNGDAARRSFQQVEDAIRHTLGPRHPAAFMAQADVALALKGTGELTEAKQTEDAALQSLQRQLASRDPRTIEVMLRCSDTQRQLGRLQDAARGCKRALSLILGPADEDPSCPPEPVTEKLLQCIRLGCRSLAALGCADQALETQQLWLHAHRCALGNGHRHTLQLMRDISCSLAQLGHHPEAVSMQFVALRICCEQYGQGDPDALKSMRLFADSLSEMGELRQAAAVVVAALPLVAEGLGQGSDDAAWLQAQHERVAVATDQATEHATRQPHTRGLVEVIHLEELLTSDTVAFKEDADRLVLQHGHPATTLSNLAEGLEVIGSPAPTRLGAVLGVRITRHATCDVALVASQLPALRLLILEGVQLESASTRKLADQLYNLRELTGLRCVQNTLGATGLGFICEVLPSLQQLSDLCVTGNNVGPRGAASLARVLPSMIHVTALDFSGNSVGEKGVEVLAHNLPWMSQLLQLGLGDNSIGPGGIKVLASSFKALTKLQALNLRNNNIGSEGAAELGQALAGLKCLTALDIAHNTLGASDMRAIITKALNVLINLQKLDVSDKAARNAEAVELERTLPRLTALAALSVWVAAPADMRSLAPGIKAVKSLKSLDLHRHQMGAEGALELGHALSALTKLTYLNVQALDVSVGMGQSGLKHVAPNLQKLRLLAHLNLADNGMGAEGVCELAHAMPYLTALTYLELGNNSVGTDGAAALGPALPHLSRLAKLKLEPDDTLDYEAFQPIACALASLPALVQVAVPDGCKDSTW